MTDTVAVTPLTTMVPAAILAGTTVTCIMGTVMVATTATAAMLLMKQ